eukprot:TRINITY_DN37176_c0_g1_i1.p1 TRINITY_DN37176_c0_g1~~TRINITY_DN37176_c0_g1_i1.p1  ORF type:complete len:203 (-),score=58.23 TRINITY_DN37176_c0_g1_i1:114-638(-)
MVRCVALVAAVWFACCMSPAVCARASDLDPRTASDFHAYWTAHVDNYLNTEHGEMVNGVERDTLVKAMSKAVAERYVPYDFYKNLSLLEATSFAQLRVGAKDFKCPAWDIGNGFVECNGPKHGVCKGKKCECLAGWSGIACQTDPTLYDYDPLFGTSEPNKACKKMIIKWVRTC